MLCTLSAAILWNEMDLVFVFWNRFFFCIKEMKSNKECHAGKDFFVRVAVAVYQTITNKR